MSNLSIKWHRVSTESMPAAAAIEAAAKSGGGYGTLRRQISGTLSVREISEGQRLTFFGTGENSTGRTVTAYSIVCRCVIIETGEELVYPLPAVLFRLQDGAPVAPSVITFAVDEETGKVKFAAGAGAPAAKTPANVPTGVKE